MHSVPELKSNKCLIKHMQSKCQDLFRTILYEKFIIYTTELSLLNPDFNVFFLYRPQGEQPGLQSEGGGEQRHRRDARQVPRSAGERAPGQAGRP